MRINQSPEGNRNVSYPSLLIVNCFGLAFFSKRYSVPEIFHIHTKLVKIGVLLVFLVVLSENLLQIFAVEDDPFLYLSYFCDVDNPDMIFDVPLNSLGFFFYQCTLANLISFCGLIIEVDTNWFAKRRSYLEPEQSLILFKVHLEVLS